MYSPAATGHSGLPLELTELPMGCFSPQMCPAGGDLPPRALVTLSPFSLLVAPSLPCLPVLVGVLDMGGPPWWLRLKSAEGGCITLFVTHSHLMRQLIFSGFYWMGSGMRTATILFLSEFCYDKKNMNYKVLLSYGCHNLQTDPTWTCCDITWKAKEKHWHTQKSKWQISKTKFTGLETTLRNFRKFL